MKDIRIRKGTTEDLTAVLELIRELAEFEKAPEEVTNNVAAMIEDFTGSSPVFKLLVATKEDELVGMAIYFTKYSTWKGKGVYLDDIVVKEQYRRKGIGKQLFDALVRESKVLGAKQLHWQVLDWNSDAIDFYKKYDAELDSEWINCKLTEEQINNFK